MPPANNEQLKCRLKHNIFLLRPPKTDVPPLETPIHSIHSHQWITVTVTKTHVNNSVCLQRCSCLVLIIPSKNFARTLPTLPTFPFSHFPPTFNHQPSPNHPPPLHPSASKFEVSNGKRFLANHNPQSTWKLLSHQLLFRFKGNSSKRF